MQVPATVPAVFRALSQPLVQLRRGNYHLMREGKSHLGSQENHSHLKPLAVPWCPGCALYHQATLPFVGSVGSCHSHLGRTSPRIQGFSQEREESQ